MKQPGYVWAPGFSASVHGHLTLLLWVCGEGSGRQSGSRKPLAAGCGHQPGKEHLVSAQASFQDNPVGDELAPPADVAAQAHSCHPTAMDTETGR